MNVRMFGIIASLLASAILWASGDTISELEGKIAAVLPTAEEDAFLQIPWRMNVLRARAESARTGKPLFIWSMNGHPFGHT